jgi:hypothetical protein
MVEAKAVNSPDAIVSTPDAVMHWQSELQPLLDDYLRRIGMQSSDLRARWIAHVLAGLHLNSGEFAADDLVEQAVEKMRDAVDTRLALVADFDRVHERREIAGALAVLQKEQHTGLLDSLFREFTNTELGELRGKLRDAIRNERPRPVPSEAPLAMPTQAIELRVLNPLRRLFGAKL